MTHHVCRALLLLWVVLPPTSVLAGEKRLTADGRFKSDPAFLDARGDQLVYVVQDGPNQTRLMRLTLADGSVSPLFPRETKSQFEPACSPDGRHLAFVQSRGNLSLGLVVRNLRTGTEAEVKPVGGFSGPRAPVITPAGRVLFSFAEMGRQKILSVNLEAGDRQVLIDTPGISNWPHVSRDGKTLTFGSTRDGNFEIYVARGDGKEPRRLTNHPRQDIRPRLSPDGKRVVFTSNRDGNYEIYLIQVNGTGLKRVTNHPERDDHAIWYPDGKRLVILSERKGKHDLYLIDAP